MSLNEGCVRVYFNGVIYLDVSLSTASLFARCVQ